MAVLRDNCKVVEVAIYDGFGNKIVSYDENRLFIQNYYLDGIDLRNLPTKAGDIGEIERIIQVEPIPEKVPTSEPVIEPDKKEVPVGRIDCS